MSVDTRGFVATDFKNPFPALGLVDSMLRKLYRLHARPLLGLSKEEREEQSQLWVQPECRMTSPGGGSVQFEFKAFGENRSLRMNFLCDCDSSDVYDGKKIFLSFGDWGISRPLARALLQPLSIFGPAYLDECDSDDRDYEPVWRDRKVNLLDLFEARLVHASEVAVSEWYDYWLSCPSLKKQDCSEFIGLSEEEVLRLRAASSTYDEGKDLLNALLEEYRSWAVPLELGLEGIKPPESAKV